MSHKFDYEKSPINKLAKIHIGLFKFWVIWNVLFFSVAAYFLLF